MNTVVISNIHRVRHVHICSKTIADSTKNLLLLVNIVFVQICFHTLISKVMKGKVSSRKHIQFHIRQYENPALQGQPKT